MVASPLRSEIIIVAWRSAMALVGALSLVFAIPLAYGILRPLCYGLASVTVGARFGLLSVALLQYCGYLLIAVFLFRYLARLCPLTMSISSDHMPPQLNYVNHSGLLPFWISLFGCLVLANYSVHRKGISLPTLTFDVVLVGLLLYDLVDARLRRLSSDTPLVLFLRPFNSFADRSLLACLLNAMPAKTQVIFLVPQNESHRSWDPFTLGMAGFHLLSPCSSTPIPIVCSNDDWIATVKYFIGRSRLVVMDLTHSTRSLEIEVDLLCESQALRRTIAFFDESTSATPETRLRRPVDFGWLAATEYRRRMDILRVLASLTQVLGAVGAVWLSVTGQLSTLLTNPLGITITLYCLCFWGLVFLKKTVNQSDVRAIVPLMRAATVGGARPMIPHMAALVGLAIAAILVCGLASSAAFHVAAGDTIPISAEVALVNGESGEARPLDYIVDNFDLRLISPVRRAGDLPDQGRSQVIVANVRNLVHFRVFDPDGIQITDTDETRLRDKSQLVAALKSRLNDLWDAPSLSASDKDYLIGAVTSIVGLDLIGYKALKEVAWWPTIPDGISVQEPNEEVEAARIEWFDEGPHSSPGLKIRFSGKITVAADFEPGPVLLCFALPEGHGRSGVAREPRLLCFDKPEKPRVSAGTFIWRVRRWTVHETRQKALAACALDAAKVTLIGTAWVLGIALCYRTIRR